MDNTLFFIDWGKVKPETIKLLESGNARVINGVARDLSHNYQIVQHMPFKAISSLPHKTDLLDIVKAVQSNQAMLGSMIAVSSVAVMGTVIISTAYLAKKLNKIQKAIDKIQQEIYGQNLIYYAERITTYFGIVEAARHIISDKNVINENPDLIVLKISELSNMRNQLSSFLDSLISLSDNFTFEHKEMAINFINMTLDLIPKGVFVESQAAYKLDRFYLGDSLREDASIKYKIIVQNYKDWANNKYRSILKGNIDSNAKAFQNKLSEIQAIVSSRENKLLLENSI